MQASEDEVSNQLSNVSDSGMSTHLLFFLWLTLDHQSPCSSRLLQSISHQP
jgi:hypothetical protein